MTPFAYPLSSTPMLNRTSFVLVTLLLGALLAACGGGDDADSEGDSSGSAGSASPVATADSGSAGSGSASGGGGGDTTEVVSDDGALTLQIPAGTDGAADISATAIDGGWDLVPDGATFEDPLIVEFQVAHNGGLPVALLESSDGTVELPPQFVRIEDGQSLFTVAVSHFSELTAIEVQRAADGAAPSINVEQRITELEELLRQELDAALDAFTRRAVEPANQENPWLVQVEPTTFGGDGAEGLPDTFDDGWRVAFLSPSAVAAYRASQADEGTANGGTADEGTQGDGADAKFLAFPSAGFAFDDAEDISDSVSVAIVEDGYLFRLEIPAAANHEGVIANGGRFQVAVSWGTTEAVVEGSVTTEEGIKPRGTVYERAGFTEVERVEPLPDSRIEGNEAFIFLPARKLDGELAVFINDSIYSGVEAIDVGAWSRDENGENLWVGATGADINAFADLTP